MAHDYELDRTRIAETCAQVQGLIDALIAFHQSDGIDYGGAVLTTGIALLAVAENLLHAHSIEGSDREALLTEAKQLAASARLAAAARVGGASA